MDIKNYTDLKTLGMIGGTSWHSTIDYYRYINSMVEAKKGTLLSPPLLLYSIDVSLMRTRDFEKISNNYLHFTQNLASAGAEAIIICANTPHLVYDFVAPKIDIPILHIADATGREAKRLGLKKIAQLGTLPTMQRDFITRRITENFGIETIVPDEKGQDIIHHIVVDELVQGKFTYDAKAKVIHQMNLLKDQGADGMIMGCTELPILIKPEDYDLPLLDTTKLHAQMAADFIMS